MLRFPFRKLLVPPPRSSGAARLPSHLRSRRLCPLTAIYLFSPSRSHFSTSVTDANGDFLTHTLRIYDISQKKTAAILAKFLKLPTFDLENTLKPKLDFLLVSGFTSAEIGDILAANPYLLRMKLERSIIPSLNFLKTILPFKKDVIRVLKYPTKSLTSGYESNIKILRQHGVPDDLIVKLLRIQPRALARSADSFSSAIKYVKGLGLDPTSSVFVSVLAVVSYMSRSTLLRKVELFKELGWSEEEIKNAFKKQPTCLKISVESIRKKVEYFRERMGWGSEFLSTNPMIVIMSLERRIIPRCAVLNVLMSRDLIRKNTLAPQLYYSSERIFYEKYVQKYETRVPEVLKAYKGEIGFQGWECLKDKK